VHNPRGVSLGVPQNPVVAGLVPGIGRLGETVTGMSKDGTGTGLETCVLGLPSDTKPELVAGTRLVSTVKMSVRTGVDPVLCPESVEAIGGTVDTELIVIVLTDVKPDPNGALDVLVGRTPEMKLTDSEVVGIRPETGVTLPVELSGKLAEPVVLSKLTCCTGFSPVKVPGAVMDDLRWRTGELESKAKQQSWCSQIQQIPGSPMTMGLLSSTGMHRRWCMEEEHKRILSIGLRRRQRAGERVSSNAAADAWLLGER